MICLSSTNKKEINMKNLKYASLVASCSLGLAVVVGLHAQPAPEDAGQAANTAGTSCAKAAACEKGKDCCRITGKTCTDSDCAKQTACRTKSQECGTAGAADKGTCAKAGGCTKEHGTPQRCGTGRGHGQRKGRGCGRRAAGQSETGEADTTCKVASCGAKACANTAAKACEADRDKAADTVPAE